VRIVSLLPSATEIVCALGLEDQLVGVTHECDFPASVRTKAVVTSSVLSGVHESGEIDRHIRRLVHEGSSLYGLDADRLQALQPDLILTQELCDVCAVSYPIVEQAVRRLEGATQLVSLEPETLDDLYLNIITVGELTGRPSQASSLVASLRHRVAQVCARVAGRRRRSVVCLEWLDPLFNCGHWTPQLVSLAGGDELLGNAGRPAMAIDQDALRKARPDVVVVMACGFELERSLEQAQCRRDAWFVDNAELWVVDGNAYFSRPGPRLIDSLEIMAAIIHPQVVATPAPESARRLA
jgi:iron complex transport system substrate-binding protein